LNNFVERPERRTPTRLPRSYMYFESSSKKWYIFSLVQLSWESKTFFFG